MRAFALVRGGGCAGSSFLIGAIVGAKRVA